MANILAIVGRPNVGKSTLFNRLIEGREAIVDNQSGVTRDRHYGEAEWNGKKFSVIDTGGYVVGSDDVFEDAIRTQVEIAMEEATAILMVVDVEAGLTPLDEEFANVVRRSTKPIFLVANKADNIDRMHMAGEFHALQLTDEIHPIAAINGSGTGDLLDEVVKVFHTTPEEEEDRERIHRIAVVGRPNAGKSSLVNLLLNQERNIVTDIAGTTRDSIDTHYRAFGKEFILTDTAGIRRKAKIKEDIEFYSILRAVKSIERSDLCIIMLDATRGLESQDLTIIRIAQSNKKAMMILVNKWDLVEKDHKTAQYMEREIRERLQPNDHIPIFFVSVIEKQRILKAMEKAVEICEERRKKVPTSKLNELLQAATQRQQPPTHRGNPVTIKYVTQLPTYSPTFAFFTNHPKHVDASYTRYLENQIRKHFGFDGVPIQIVYKQK